MTGSSKPQPPDWNSTNYLGSSTICQDASYQEVCLYQECSRVTVQPIKWNPEKFSSVQVSRKTFNGGNSQWKVTMASPFWIIEGRRSPLPWMGQQKVKWTEDQWILSHTSSLGHCWLWTSGSCYCWFCVGPLQAGHRGGRLKQTTRPHSTCLIMAGQTVNSNSTWQGSSGGSKMLTISNGIPTTSTLKTMSLVIVCLDRGILDRESYSMSKPSTCLLEKSSYLSHTLDLNFIFNSGPDLTELDEQV